MSAATLTFEEKGHKYAADGVSIPSVSQVLELSGISDVSGVPEHLLRRAAERGTAVHLACEYLDEDDLDLESLTPEVMPYVVAYQKFREDYHFKAELIEHQMIGESEGLRYGMRFDRVGTFNGEERILLDIKTASRAQSSWTIQTAAYVLGFSAVDTHQAPGRAVVHLAKDGSYRVLLHTLDSDFDIWRSALMVAHWRLANGAKYK
jgi:hypothetical protein